MHWLTEGVGISHGHLSTFWAVWPGKDPCLSKARNMVPRQPSLPVCQKCRRAHHHREQGSVWQGSCCPARQAVAEHGWQPVRCLV